MQQKSIRLNFFLVTILILLAVLSRLFPHPANFAPMMAIGIFGGAMFKEKRWAYIVPLLSIWLSDLLLNNVVFGGYFEGFVWFYEGWYWQYAAYLLVPFLSTLLFKNNISAGKVALMGIGSGLLFFLVSNFGVWYSTTMYPKTGEGLLLCYTMGLPYLKGTLLGNLFYSVILFGSFYLLEKRTILFSPSVQHNWRWI
jgi:hypothetical protein